MKTMFDEMRSLSGNEGKRKIAGVVTDQNIKLCNIPTDDLWAAKLKLEELHQGVETQAVMGASRRIQKELDFRGSYKAPPKVYLQRLNQLFGLANIQPDNNLKPA